MSQIRTVSLSHNGVEADLFFDWDRLAKIAEKFPNELSDMRGLEGRDVAAAKFMLKTAGAPDKIFKGKDALPYLEGVRLVQQAWNLCMHGPEALKEPSEDDASGEGADPENFQSDTF